LLAAWLVVVALPGQQSSYTHESREAIVKTDAPRETAIDFGNRVDRWVGLLEEFYAPLKLRRRSSNRIVVRLMTTPEDVQEAWQRHYQGHAPTGFFSPALNAIVLYHDPQDPWTRQSLPYLLSHQYLRRCTPDAPEWLEVGLAKYFQGWRIPEGSPPEKRPSLDELIYLQDAVRSGSYLRLQDLCALTSKQFKDFENEFPQLDSHLPYATSWALTYYALHGPSQEDRNLWIEFIRRVTRQGSRAKLEPSDWTGLETRWKDFVMSLEAKPKDIDDFLLVGSAFRCNGEYEKAIATYEELLRRFPEAKPRALFWIGYCLKCGSRYREASVALEQARAADPTDPRPPYYLARIAIGSDLRDAPPVTAADAARALELARIAADNSSSPQYHLFLADCQAGVGDYKAAVKTMRTLIDRADKEARQRYDVKLKELLSKGRRTAQNAGR